MPLPAGLPLRPPVVRHFTGGSGRRLRPDERRVIVDLLASYGMPPPGSARGGQTFRLMGDGLLDSLDRPLPPLDAVILAYESPDIAVADQTGCHLVHRCPGDPVGFSVSGQGVGAPFTALRILRAMRSARKLTDGAVFVFDQSTSLYAETGGVPQDCAVLIGTDSRAHDRLVLDAVREEGGDDPTASLFARPRGTLVIAGVALAQRVGRASLGPQADVKVAQDQGCAGVWAALAAHWSPDRHTLVAEYDPGSGRLFQALLRPATEHNARAR